MTRTSSRPWRTRILRERFMRVPVGISGANFAIAETGTIVLVESEGNGRMCTTLPQTLISIMGIEKVLPAPADLGTMLGCSHAPLRASGWIPTRRCSPA